MTIPTELPYAGLDPQRVMQAVESLGLRCDGRVLALNSFENRVFRVGIEDAAARVVKFYRPARWSDAAIGEEHAFTCELARSEEHTSELQSLMRISYAVFRLKK